MDKRTTRVSSIVNRLALGHGEKAAELLGCLAGPGVDIKIFPTDPISAQWHLYGNTEAGSAFLNKLWPDRIVPNSRVLNLFKREVTDWGLTCETDWSNVLSAKDKP